MTAAIDKRMTRARAALVMSQPFYGTLALGLEIVERTDVTDTMATDGKMLAYNPAFLDELTERELEGVIAHEVSHCAFRHMTRRGDRDPGKWNEACDYVINGGLVAAGFALPKCALLDSRFNGMGSEAVYAELERQQKQKQPQPGDGTPQSGQGSGGGGGGAGDGEPQKVPDPGRCGGVLDAAPAHNPTEQARVEGEWETRVRQAVAVASRHAGRVPAGLDRLVEDLQRSRIDWRDTLRRFIDDRANTRTSWQQPNKRYLAHGFVLPGRVRDGVTKIVGFVDTSGSIDEKTLGAFAGELQAMMDEDVIGELVIVYCDAAICGVERFAKGDPVILHPKGGGGTAFSPAFEWLEENEPDAAAVVFLTDMCCSDWGQEPECPVLWGAYGNPTYRREPPFGEVMEVGQ